MARETDDDGWTLATPPVGATGLITWSPTDHVGIHATFPVVCCNGDYTWKTAGQRGISY